MSRYLIFGATGPLGLSMIGWLRPHGHEIITVGRRAPAANVTRHHAWDLEGGGLPPSLDQRVDHVIYLASSEKYRDFPAQASAVFAVGTAGALMAADYARRVGAESFVLASSGAVSATTADLKFYALTKRMAEQSVRIYADAMRVRILRPYYIYGHGQRPSALIPRLIDRVKEGLPIFLQGENGPVLNPINAMDAARAFIAAATCDTVTDFPIDICGMHRYTLRRIVEIIGEVVGRDPIFEHAEGSPVDTCGDPDDMLVNLHEPTVDLADGIAGVAGVVRKKVAWA